MINTVVGFTEEPQELWDTHITFSLSFSLSQASVTEKPLETTPTGWATFLKKFPGMSLSAHQGHREDNQQPFQSIFHRPETDSGATSGVKSTAAHTVFTEAPPFLWMRFSCFFTEKGQLRKYQRAKAAPPTPQPGQWVEPSNNDGRNDKRANTYRAFDSGPYIW